MVDQKSFPVRRRLPTIYYTHIGRLTSRWAYLEWRLRRISYALMRTSPKHGRVAVREPRVVDHLTMIEDLMYLEKMTSTVNFSSLRKSLGEVESWRDKCAHGIWVKHGNSNMPVLQDTRGSHPQNFAPNAQARKARINPKAQGVTLTNLRNWIHVIDVAVKALEHLGKEIDAQRKDSSQHQAPSPAPGTSAADLQIET